MGFAAALGVAACGGSAAQNAAGPSSPDVNDAHSAGPSSTGVPIGSHAAIQSRLQGTWEIVRYTSEHPIPDDAMPLMGDLFDKLRLHIDGDTVGARAGRQAEEHAHLVIADEQGDAFRLVAKGGLFDGAKCRFVDADTWEATDHGPAWPGVSLLRRVKR
jgi:hypothetical protein